MRSSRSGYRSRYRKPLTYPSSYKPKNSDPTVFGFPIETRTWMESYTGSDTFLLSLNKQLSQYNHLSETQWRYAHAAMQAAINGGKSNKVPLAPLTLKTPLPILINRTAAFREIRDKYKLQYGIFALAITKVNSTGTARNGNDWAEIEVIPDANATVSSCRICGKTLTDHRSVVSGIGSVCAKKYFPHLYITYKTDIDKFIAAFKVETSKLGTFTIKIWANQVKENVGNLHDAITQFKMQSPSVAIMPPPAPKPASTLNSASAYTRVLAQGTVITPSELFAWDKHLRSNKYLGSVIHGFGSPAEKYASHVVCIGDRVISGYSLSNKNIFYSITGTAADVRIYGNGLVEFLEDFRRTPITTSGVTSTPNEPIPVFTYTPSAGTIKVEKLSNHIQFTTEEIVFRNAGIPVDYIASFYIENYETKTSVKFNRSPVPSTSNEYLFYGETPDGVTIELSIMKS